MRGGLFFNAKSHHARDEINRQRRVDRELDGTLCMFVTGEFAGKGLDARGARIKPAVFRIALRFQRNIAQKRVAIFEVPHGREPQVQTRRQTGE